MNKLQMFLKAVYAGFMIGIGGIVYLSVENRVAGSMLFSFGLLTIVTQGFFLYTGKVGFARTGKALLDMPLIVAGNYVGTFVAAMLARGGGLAISTGNLVMGKLDKSMGCVFVLSVFCGVLMYLAIDNYNKTKNIVFIIAPVMIFILSGFEHSIANMFYFHLAGVYHGKALVWLLVMVVGNGVGAWVFGMNKGDCVPGNSRI
ncbi:MAG: formate/nitrite transporter family protein [Lachnospiraceae bacterium]|jgi:formate/nitrite transporter FocA (FNT family)|nr:formate/nitrite transporter family protein [Lachnospiraceae bacterium]